MSISLRGHDEVVLLKKWERGKKVQEWRKSLKTLLIYLKEGSYQSFAELPQSPILLHSPCPQEKVIAQLEQPTKFMVNQLFPLGAESLRSTREHSQNWHGTDFHWSHMNKVTFSDHKGPWAMVMLRHVKNYFSHLFTKHWFDGKLPESCARSKQHCQKKGWHSSGNLIFSAFVAS